MSNSTTATKNVVDFMRQRENHSDGLKERIIQAQAEYDRFSDEYMKELNKLFSACGQSFYVTTPIHSGGSDYQWTCHHADHLKAERVFDTRWFDKPFIRITCRSYGHEFGSYSFVVNDSTIIEPAFSES